MSMAHAVNPGKYGKLLTTVQPRAIETEEDNERALAVISKLMREGEASLSTEELCLLKLLAVLVENYERHEYPMEESSPRDMLLFFMEQHGLRQKDLVGVFGSRSVVSEVVNGKRGISKSQAKKLANLFHASAELFI